MVGGGRRIVGRPTALENLGRREAEVHRRAFLTMESLEGFVSAHELVRERLAGHGPRARLGDPRAEAGGG